MPMPRLAPTLPPLDFILHRALERKQAGFGRASTSCPNQSGRAACSSNAPTNPRHMSPTLVGPNQSGRYASGPQPIREKIHPAPTNPGLTPRCPNQCGRRSPNAPTNPGFSLLCMHDAGFKFIWLRQATTGSSHFARRAPSAGGDSSLGVSRHGLSRQDTVLYFTFAQKCAFRLGVKTCLRVDPLTDHRSPIPIKSASAKQTF